MSEPLDLSEWRERIGVQIMHAMRCTHEFSDFGDGAVCETCFENTQRIGSLVETNVRQQRAAALREAANLIRDDGPDAPPAFMNPYDRGRLVEWMWQRAAIEQP